MMLSKYQPIRNSLIADQIFRPAQSFFKNEASSSVLLLLSTIVALVWVNSYIAETYHHLWRTKFSIAIGDYCVTKSLIHWIDEGLMTFFFFTVGLEIKREILVGELSSTKKALLPVIAALGGMIVPGAIYFAFNFGTSTAGGWGIPMATDIAFALGAIAVFGKKLPVGLRIFLSAFAIADDLGAVLIIALFYTQEIVWHYLVVSIFFIFALALANFLWIRWTLLYVLLGLAIWFAVLGSGIHPTVAGIVVAMFIPARGKYDTDRFVQKVKKLMGGFQCEDQGCGYSILLDRDHLDAVHALEVACHDVETPLQRMEHALHPWVAFLVLPLFALCNAGLSFHGLSIADTVVHPLALGITLGLCVGKPLGITLFSYVAAKAGIVSLPDGVSWSHILGVSMLGGIGFTMSLFISGLSFPDPDLYNLSRLWIFVGSLLAAFAGLLLLGVTCVLSRNSEQQA